MLKRSTKWAGVVGWIGIAAVVGVSANEPLVLKP